MSPGWNDLLEVANGVWSIVALWLAIFLGYHLLKIRERKNLPWSRIFNLPVSMQLAVGTLIVSSAIFINRSALWFESSKHGGDVELSYLDSAWCWFLVGTIFGIAGFLCILRTVTRPMLGHWPWVGALLNVAVYVAWWAAKFF